VAARIREAQPGEEQRLLELFPWLFAAPGSTPPGWDPEQAQRRLTETLIAPESVVLVAEDGGRMVGFCSAYMTIDTVRFGRRCLVEELAVDPERRSQGIGKALLDTAKEWARGAGASHLELDSGIARTDAHRFYEREQPSWKSYSFGWEL
jgi:GNAT superfamily N-acetyltransferase